MYLFFPQFFILLPWLLTHIIPAIIFFIWIIISLCCFNCCLIFCLTPYYPRGEDGKIEWTAKGEVIAAIWFRFVALLTILFMQTGFNYMVLFYHRTSYNRVFADEWNLRNTQCYIQTLQTSGQHLFTFTTYS